MQAQANISNVIISRYKVIHFFGITTLKWYFARNLRKFYQNAFMGCPKFCNCIMTCTILMGNYNTQIRVLSIRNHPLFFLGNR